MYCIYALNKYSDDEKFCYVEGKYFTFGVEVFGSCTKFRVTVYSAPDDGCKLPPKHVEFLLLIHISLLSVLKAIFLSKCDHL